jgi:DNA mismatch repair ATPase MutS
LEDTYENYHFKETVTDNDVTFDYVLNKGRATTRNAIRLLKILGYDEKIIESADKTAENYLKTGEWRKQ